MRDMKECSVEIKAPLNQRLSEEDGSELRTGLGVATGSIVKVAQPEKGPGLGKVTISCTVYDIEGNLQRPCPISALRKLGFNIPNYAGCLFQAARSAQATPQAPASS